MKECGIKVDILYMILNAVLVAAALSLDAFVAGFAYGGNKTKIPLKSALVINVVCSLILGASLFSGALVKEFIPVGVTVIVSFAILFILGGIKLLDSGVKALIRKHERLRKKMKFSMFGLNFVLKVYADPEEADADRSKEISVPEAVSLAAALSLDGIAVGFGASLAGINPLAVFAASLVTDFLALVLGVFAGEKAAGKLPFNISWLGGVILIGMAISKLL